MVTSQRLPASLTPLETARAALLHRLEPVASVRLPLAETPGSVAADQPPFKAVPPYDLAIADGWALRARDLVGASSYSPLPLANAPAFVEAGDRMPEGCDCVIPADLVELSGAMAQVLAEAIPGQGVRRLGGDIAEGVSPIVAGRPIRTLDLLIARAAGLQELNVRRPQLRVVDIPPASGQAVTATLIAECARAAGASVVVVQAAGRDAESIAEALDTKSCDLVVMTGGSGVGRTDAAVVALARRGEVAAHGIALQPGRTAAVGWIGKTPVIALPGAPDQALAAWWTLVLPALDRLSGRQTRATVTLPLARKIASSVGLAEIVLLEKIAGAWMPLATGDLALKTLACADAWLVVMGGAEGFAAGTPVDAYMLRE